MRLLLTETIYDVYFPVSLGHQLISPSRVTKLESEVFVLKQGHGKVYYKFHYSHIRHCLLIRLPYIYVGTLYSNIDLCNKIYTLKIKTRTRRR